MAPLASPGVASGATGLFSGQGERPAWLLGDPGGFAGVSQRYGACRGGGHSGAACPGASEVGGHVRPARLGRWRWPPVRARLPRRVPRGAGHFLAQGL